MSRTRSEQEAFWEDQFGNDYTVRNQIDPTDRVPFFEHILGLTGNIGSVCELGSNRGHNLLALRAARPDIALTGVELNGQAFDELSRIPGVTAVKSSIQDLNLSTKFDLVFTCGVLIHINPDDLKAVYDKLAGLSGRYVLINEYFNPTPVEIPYRGHSGRLFKRDFAGEFLDRHPSMRVVGYGFLWRRLNPGWDDSTWVLMARD